MKVRLLPATTAFILLAGISAQATLINEPLTGDGANSSPAAFGGSLAATLNDGFAYDPENPIAALPNQVYTQPVGNGFHGDLAPGTPANLSYNLAGGAFLFTDTFVVDIYGRSSFEDRDNDIEVMLFSGGVTGTQVASLTGLAVVDTSPFHVRASFSPPGGGAVIDSIRIVGNDSNGLGDNNFFTVMEVRAAGTMVPEPDSLALAVLGMAVLLGRAVRRRAS